MLYFKESLEDSPISLQFCPINKIRSQWIEVPEINRKKSVLGVHH